jgi:Na+(H+)/acetate symporter ActP
MIMETGLLIYISGLVIMIFVAGMFHKKDQDIMETMVGLAMAFLWPSVLPLLVIFALLKKIYDAGMWTAVYFKNKGE